MPVYELEVYELWLQTFLVEGANAAEAVRDFQNGTTIGVPGIGPEYIEMADAYGGDPEYISSDSQIKQELLAAGADLAGIYNIELLKS